MKLTIIIPVYNEDKTISKVLGNVDKVKISGVEKEIIVVDDGSSDNSKQSIQNSKIKNLKKIFHQKNMGKGAAIKSGISLATGDYIIIQDADLEYDPSDIPILFSHLEGKKIAVYGTRLARLPHLKNEERKLQFLIHYFGNRFLSLLTSILYGQWLTDMETCYKLFPRSVVKGVSLRSRRFDFEPEITAKLLKRGLRIKEIPIKTNPRGYDEGKKLNTVKDGIIALLTLIKYRFVD